MLAGANRISGDGADGLLHSRCQVSQVAFVLPERSGRHTTSQDCVQTLVNLRIRLFASFREAVGSSAITWAAPESATVGQVVSALRETYPKLGPALDRAMLAVNQEYVGPELRLHDGDELALIPPVSGG